METDGAREKVREMAKQINSFARTLFERDGSHVALAMFLDKDAKVIPPPMMLAALDCAGSEYRRRVFSAAVKAGVLACVTVAEAWLRAGGFDDHTMKQLLHGEMRISDLNENDRTEALVVTAVMRDGFSVLITNAVDRSSGRAELKEACLVEAGPEDGGIGMGGRLADVWKG